MRLICLALCCWLASAGAGLAQQPIAQKLAAYMQAQQAVNQFSGVVLVTRHDTVLLRQAYGLADYEWAVPNTLNTKFALASITKQFTAVAILQLAERGRLRLTDKLSAFILGFPNGDAITLHMLLTHTAGLPLDFEELYLEHTGVSKDSALVYIKKLPVQFAPGTSVAYSNLGYYVLGLVIEKASGMTYGSFLQRNIFDVAGMTQTGLYSNTALVPRLARGYLRQGEGFIKNPYINWDLNIGHDGVYSTADDLAKYERALLGTALLSEASKSLMNTQHNSRFPGNGFIDRYGYGVFINPYFNHGHDMLTHSGGYFGAITTLDSYPKDGILVTVLSNNESESHWIGYGLAGILFGKNVELPYVHRPAAANPAELPKYAGQYGEVRIGHADGRLFLNKADTPLVAESARKFFRQDLPDRTYEFLTNRKGAVYAVVATKGGVKETLLRSKPTR